MSAICVAGVGAVSPAGWGVRALVEAVCGERDLPVETTMREHGGGALRAQVRRVPKPEGPNPFPRHPRLRRGSPITQFLSGAAAEALGEDRIAEVAAGKYRLGILCTLLNGGVSYSTRFFAEILSNPSLASPILFPETVRNAPSSHLSAVFGSSAPNDTLIGDGATFLPALELAVAWLESGDLDGCLVAGAEELDWSSAEGLAHYSRQYVAAEGAGAVLLEVAPPTGILLAAVPDPAGLCAGREEAARLIRGRMEVADDGQTLLVDGRAGVPRWDRPEEVVWADWRGPRLSPRMVLGEGMGASAAWQTVTAIERLRAGAVRRAVVSAVGGNQQAAGAAFVSDSAWSPR